MTAKDFVKQHYPNAKAESHKPNGFAPRYWLIRDGRSVMYMAEGETQSKAWVNAKKYVMNKLKLND